MFSVKFDWKEDEEYGGEGWIPSRFPNFNVNDGRSVAHDTLEHFANDDETLAAEMRALGAMIYIRGDGGYFANLGGSTKVNLGADIAHFLQELVEGQHSGYHDLPAPPRTYRLGNSEETIEDVMKEGRKQFVKEMAYGESSFSNSDVDTWLYKMRGWIRIGYRKAVRRYHKADSCELTYLFEQIAEHVDLKHRGGDIGEILTVRVDPRNLRFTTHQDFPHDEYYN